uniref:Uncharacterized protein n=1 Tax=Fagus sylvatica TaxID=28930 RepID=A0A2N9I9L2_FAGSY
MQVPIATERTIKALECITFQCILLSSTMSWTMPKWPPTLHLVRYRRVREPKPSDLTTKMES